MSVKGNKILTLLIVGYIRVWVIGLGVYLRAKIYVKVVF